MSPSPVWVGVGVVAPLVIHLGVGRRWYIALSRHPVLFHWVYMMGVLDGPVVWSDTIDWCAESIGVVDGSPCVTGWVSLCGWVGGIMSIRTLPQQPS